MAHIQKIQEPPCLSTYSKRVSARHQRRRSWTRGRYKRLVWCICVLNVAKFFSSLHFGKKRWCKSPPSGLRATEMVLVSELFLFVFVFEYGRSKAPFFGRACLFPIFIKIHVHPKDTINISFWEVHEKPSACHCCSVVNKTQSLLLLTSSRLNLLD